MWLLVSVVVLFAGARTGNAGDCDEYSKVIKTNGNVVLRWADAEIFARTFVSQDFRVAGMIGPGRNGANFSIDRSRIQTPAWLSEYNIRSIGPDRFHPDVLLIGKRRYEGIVITRGELEPSLKGTSIEFSKLIERSARLGAMCFVD